MLGDISFTSLGRARPRRSSAAPARARPRCSTSSRACSTSPPARCWSTASTCATSTPSCCGAASASCRRSRTCSPGTVASNLRYADPDATDERAVGGARDRPGSDFVRGDARRPRRADRPGRHQRVGRPAPAPGDRPGAGAPARRSTSSTTRSRRSTCATDARLRAALAPYTADAHGDRRGPAGVDDHATPTRSSCSRTASTVGLGTHDELLETCPTYAEIVASQMTDRGGGVSTDDDATGDRPTSRRRRRRRRPTPAAAADAPARPDALASACRPRSRRTSAARPGACSAGCAPSGRG